MCNGYIFSIFPVSTIMPLKPYASHNLISCSVHVSYTEHDRQVLEMCSRHNGTPYSQPIFMLKKINCDTHVMEGK